MSYLDWVYIGILLLNIIGFYYVIKTAISYFKFGLNAGFEISILRDRSRWVFLFALCFLGISLIKYMLTADNTQLFYAALHGFAMVTNYGLYVRYKNIE